MESHTITLTTINSHNFCAQLKRDNECDDAVNVKIMEKRIKI